MAWNNNNETETTQLTNRTNSDSFDSQLSDGTNSCYRYRSTCINLFLLLELCGFVFVFIIIGLVSYIMINNYMDRMEIYNQSKLIYDNSLIYGDCNVTNYSISTNDAGRGCDCCCQGAPYCDDYAKIWKTIHYTISVTSTFKQNDIISMPNNQSFSCSLQMKQNRVAMYKKHSRQMSGCVCNGGKCTNCECVPKSRTHEPDLSLKKCYASNNCTKLTLDKPYPFNPLETKLTIGGYLVLYILILLLMLCFIPCMTHCLCVECRYSIIFRNVIKWNRLDFVGKIKRCVCSWYGHKPIPNDILNKIVDFVGNKSQNAQIIKKMKINTKMKCS
eukprot:478031_1